MFSSIDKLLQMHTDKPSQKRTTKYGLQIAKGIFNSADKNTDGYYGKRYRIWRACREFSSGTNSMKEFMDLLRVEGNQSYINLDWSTIKIAPKFVEIMLGKFMSRREKPIVKAIDDMSFNIKEMERQEAMYRMKNKEAIMEIEAAIGHQVESQKFMPEDEDELSLYFDLEYRLPEEIMFETKLKKILDENDYSILKRQLLRDVIDCNFAVTKVYYDGNNNIKIKRCKPENTIYNVFETDNGKDLAYIGQVFPMKISVIRKKYNIDEETLFKLAQKASRELKRNENLYWRESYKYTELRPYDDYSVLVFDFEVKTTDVEYAVKTVNQFGNTLVVPKQGRPVPPPGQEMSGEVLEEKVMNVYHGVWVCETDIMLKWDLTANTIRPYNNNVDAYFSYSVINPNTTGALTPSMIEKAMGPIRQMLIIRLKMQQLIALMRPDGFAVDIEGLTDVDLGLGNTVEPLKLMKIYDQTGRVYWSSKSDDGNPKNFPITQLPNNGNVAQLNTLVNQYNFELSRLREEMGISEYQDASSVPVKTGLGVMNNQIQSSNNATEYIYDAFTNLMEETCEKVSMMLWDNIIFKASKYKEFEGYEMSLLDMTFDIKIDLMADDARRQELNALMNTALQAGSLTYEQVFKIKNIEDTKLAELYLSKAMKRAQKDREEQSARLQQQNAQVQMQSAQQKAQMDMQQEQMVAQSKIAVNQSKGESDKDLEMIKFATMMYAESLKTGQPLPANIQQICDTVLGSVMQEKMQKQQQQVMAQQQMEQAQEQGQPEE